MKLDRANSGREPPARFLRAIRHGVAAGACRVAARASGDVRWVRTAARQSGLVVVQLDHAAAASASASRRRRRFSAISASRSAVTPS